MTDEILKTVERELFDKHPVMAAMATKIERVPGPKTPKSICAVRLTFDGPALPEKQLSEIVIYHAGAVHALLPEWFDKCEQQIAAAMKKSGLGV